MAHRNPAHPIRRSALALQAAWLCLSIPASVWAAGPTGLLNDTGQTQCNNGTTYTACTPANSGRNAPLPGQDGRFGRDAGTPSKVGGGAAGFDFTRVCMNGSLSCQGAANTGATPSSGDWACTLDNVTQLVWSLQSGQGEWTTYARQTLPASTNSAARCGYSTGWRLPTRHELLSIVHHGQSSGPSIDSNYFPATQSWGYWTGDVYQPNNTMAWFVYFGGGDAYAVVTTTASGYVRLVHNAP